MYGIVRNTSSPSVLAQLNFVCTLSSEWLEKNFWVEIRDGRETDSTARVH